VIVPVKHISQRAAK